MVSQLDLAGTQLCGIWTDRQCHQRGTYTAEGITAIADALRVNGALTALNLSSDCLKDEGVSAVCEAIQSNKETKLASLNFADNNIGPVGANAVAAMVAVTGGLTSLNLAGTTSVDVGWNDITGNVAQELATVVLSKPTLEIFCNIPIKKLRADSLSELDLSGKGVGVPGALVLANLLPVTGGLTSLNLSDNQLCGLDHHGSGTYTAEGITAIADALRVNGALTQVLAF